MTGVLDELSQFSCVVMAVNDACNHYVSNQVPSFAEKVERRARELVDTYLVSSDPNIKNIVNDLNQALSKDRSNDINAESHLVDDIRNIVNIIESRNIVLTYQADKPDA